MPSSDTQYKPGQSGSVTTYKPEYCQVLIENMAKGFSIIAIAGIIGVCKATIYNWVDQFPDFKDAFNTGTALRHHYFESQAIRAIDGSNPKCNGTILSIMMSSQLGISATQRMEHSGKVDSTVTIKFVDSDDQ